MDYSTRLEKALERFEKDVNISFAGPTPNSLLARQDLEAALVVLSDRLTPFRDKATRIKGEGVAHLWNQRTSLGTTANGPQGLIQLWYSDGNIPAENDPNYVQQTAAYKYLGTTVVITGPMIASGRSYMDIEAEMAEAGLRRAIQAEEWADFHGSTSINSLMPNGFDNILVTNVLDLHGAQLSSNGVNIPAFDKLINYIRNQGGSHISAIYCSFGQQNIINNITSAAARYFLKADGQSSQETTAGINAVAYQSTLGPIPVVGNFFVNPALPYPYNFSSTTAGSSGAQGNPTASDIYFIRHDDQGAVLIDLMPLGRTELAKIADSVRFYMNEYTVPVIKGEPWCGTIINAGEPGDTGGPI